jgi:predicted rRNA methylase YqxC with S4 and FtsJ domains
MNTDKHIRRLHKQLIKAETCESREEALKIIHKYEVANAKLQGTRVVDKCLQELSYSD